jgi:hypothetical protein
MQIAINSPGIDTVSRLDTSTHTPQEWAAEGAKYYVGVMPTIVAGGIFSLAILAHRKPHLFLLRQAVPKYAIPTQNAPRHATKRSIYLILINNFFDLPLSPREAFAA